MYLNLAVGLNQVQKDVTKVQKRIDESSSNLHKSAITLLSRGLIGMRILMLVYRQYSQYISF